MYNFGQYPNYYIPPVPDQLAQLKMPQQTAGTGPVWVQGEAGAKSYLVAPNTTVMLMDSESPRFFMKSSDQSGIPLPLRIFKFEEVTGQNASAAAPEVDWSKFITRDEFEEFRANLPACKCKKTKEVKEDEQPFV